MSDYDQAPTNSGHVAQQIHLRGGLGIAELFQLSEKSMSVMRKANFAMMAPDQRKTKIPSISATRLVKWWKMPMHRLRSLLKASPELPQGRDIVGDKRSFSADETWKLARVARDKSMRPENSSTFVITVGHFKGGVGKTTTSVSLAQALALLGHRVLVIDTDPQGSATQLFTGNTTTCDASKTLAPLFAGETTDLSYAIDKTHWQGIDIIQGAPALFEAEVNLPTRQQTHSSRRQRAHDNLALQSLVDGVKKVLAGLPSNLKDQLVSDELKSKITELETRLYNDGPQGDPGNFRFWDVLKIGLQSIDKQYDFIVIDTPPSISYLTLNCYAAAHGVIHPLPDAALDYQSSVEFWALLADIQRGLSEYGHDLWWQFAAVLRSKVVGAKDSEQDPTRAYVARLIEQSYGRYVLDHHIPQTKMSEKAAAMMGTAFDLISTSDTNQSRLADFTTAYIGLATWCESQAQGFWKSY